MSSNPHDQLFKSTFSEIDNARGFLKVSLPQEISKHIDWNALRLQSGSFVDEKLREIHSDLLFRTHMGKSQCFLYILAEHKSENDPWVLFQLLQYQVAIWKRFRKEHPKQKNLPLIIPLVVSHANNGWKVSKRFEDLFQVEAEFLPILKNFLPSFECVVQDLTQKQEEEIRHWSEVSAAARLTSLLLKSMREASHPIEMMASWVDVLQEIERLPGALDYFSFVFNYVFRVKKISTQEGKMLLDFINQKVGEQAKEAVMTGAERLISEGIQKGRAEGIQKGRATVVLKQLQLKFGELSEKQEEKVTHATETELDRIIEQILTDATLQELLG